MHSKWHSYLRIFEFNLTIYDKFVLMTCPKYNSSFYLRIFTIMKCKVLNNMVKQLTTSIRVEAPIIRLSKRVVGYTFLGSLAATMNMRTIKMNLATRIAQRANMKTKTMMMSTKQMKVYSLRLAPIAMTRATKFSTGVRAKAEEEK